MIELVNVDGRKVFWVEGSRPASFLFVDPRAGGMLVNSPQFDERLLRDLRGPAQVNFIFYPSRFGAVDVDVWREASGARTLASAEEVADIPGVIDEPIDGGVRLYGRLDFLLLPGRTRGTCALRSRVDPAIVFFGPALDHDDWPALHPHDDDYSFENRLIGALGLPDLAFEFAFCDNYHHGLSRFGPGASRATAAAVATVLSG